MRVFLSVPAVLFLLTAAASPAAAQEAAECTVDTYQPSQLVQAGIAIGAAASAATPDDASKALRDAMKFLKDEEETTEVNPVGTGFLKAQIYILWLHQDGVADVMTNETLNAPGPKTGTVDLVVASDSLLDAQAEWLATGGQDGQLWAPLDQTGDQISEFWSHEMLEVV